MDPIHTLLVLAPRDTKGSGGRRHPIGAPSRAAPPISGHAPDWLRAAVASFQSLPTSVNTVLTKAGLLSPELLRRGGIEADAVEPQERNPL